MRENNIMESILCAKQASSTSGVMLDIFSRCGRLVGFGANASHLLIEGIF